MSYNSNENRVQTPYTGVYVIVDNEYLPWSCTVPPFLMSNKIDKTRWLKWTELMRKDVEVEDPEIWCENFWCCER